MVAGRESAPVPAVREAHLRDYWKIVWQGRWTILALFAITVGATTVWTYMQTPVYRATATIEVQPQARRVLSGGDVSGLGAAGYGWFAEEKYHNTQVEIIKSRDVATRVVSTLGLRSHPMFAEHPDPVEALRSMIQVDPRRDTGLLEISFTGSDPQEIAQWANAVAATYVQRNMDKAKYNVEVAMQAIKEQMVALRADLTFAEETRIEALQDEEGEILNSMQQEKFINERLQTFNTQLTAARIELNSLDNRLYQIRHNQKRGLGLMTLPEFAGNVSLKELQDTKLKLQRDLAAAEVELGPAHPEYAGQQASLELVEGNIANKVSLIVAELQAKLAMARTKEQYLSEQILVAEAFSVRVARATSRYDIVKTDVETTKQIFDMIRITMKEVQLSYELMNNNVTVLDEATPPLFPIAPRKRVNLIIGAMLGMFLGLGAVFFLDYLDNTIRTPEDVEKYLGLTVIGVVPKMQKGEMTRAAKEAYQSLRTSIIFSSKNRQHKVALVTSSSPREGKSSTVEQLGKALAAAGDRIVILDCDLRRPTQHIHHGLERDPGLTNYLAAPADEHDWSAYLKIAQPANLHIMTSGPLPPSPPDLLGNERFKAMLTAMRESYDWVLIDSPPAASLADATLLAALADMVVLVVQHNSTDRDHVVKTVQQMRSVNPNFAGVVLNNVDIDRAYHKDYYYAGYYYESDEKEGKGRRFKKKHVERKAQIG